MEPRRRNVKKGEINHSFADHGVEKNLEKKLQWIRIDSYSSITVLIFVVVTVIVANILSALILPAKNSNLPNSVCKFDNLHEDARSAINRAKSQQCKEDLTTISCMSPSDLYPNHIPSFCNFNIDEKKLNNAYLGCYRDSFEERILNNSQFSSKENSPQECIRYCSESGFQYSGVQFTDECFCGHSKPNKDLLLDEAKCNKICPGDKNKFCGGYLTMNVYKTSKVESTLKDNQQTENEVKVAYLFVVHGRSLRQIKRHLKWLYNPSDYFFFHVDSRSSYLYREIKKLERQSPKNIKVTEYRWATIWGGASLLKMMMSCMSEMKQMQWNMDFVINISESDYILKKPLEFKEFLAKNQGKNFVKSNGRDTATFVKDQGLNQTFYECDNHMYHLGPRSLPSGFKVDGGSDWVCLSKDFMEYILDKENQDKMLEGLFTIFNYTLLPAESFFHIALRNSQFCSSKVNNNLRIINWKRQLGCKCQHKRVVDWCGCSPMVFQMGDMEKVQESKSHQVFFARKFDAKISQTVINEIDKWILRREDEEDILDYTFDESYEKYWENIYHHLDDSKSDNPILELANILLENNYQIDVERIAQVEEITVLFVHDHLESLLVLFQSEDGLKFESKFFINSKSKNITNSDFEISLSVGSNFDVKENVFRNLVQVVGKKQLPQLLVRAKPKKIELKDHQKTASVFWMSPFGQLVASNQSININITIGLLMVEFPPNLQRIPGIWSAIFLDHDVGPHYLRDFTVIEFLVYSKNYMFSLKRELRDLEVIDDTKITGHLSKIKANKIAHHHHSIAAIKKWVKSAYQLSDACQVQTGSCHSTNWSSKSLDTKSSIKFEL